MNKNMDIFSIVIFIITVIGSLSTIFYILDYLKKNKKITWKDVTKASENLFSKMARDKYNPTMIIGIGRGGSIIGALISGLFGHIPLIVIDRKYTWINGRRYDDIILKVDFPENLLERVLLVSGETHTGNTIRFYYNYFQKIGAKEIKKATFLYSKESVENIDYIGLIGKGNEKLPWMLNENYVKEDRNEEEYNKIKHTEEENKDRVVYLVRHGETIANVEEIFSGVTNVELTEKGVFQAQKVVEFLYNEHIERIYTSQLKRALDFARIIQEKTETKIIIDQRLSELDYGDWEGLSKNEIKEKYGLLYQQYEENPISYRPKNSEGINNGLNRILEFWSDLKYLMAEENIKRVIVIIHNDIGRLLLCKIKDIPINRYRDLNLDNGSITKIVLGKYKEQIVFENKIA